MRVYDRRFSVRIQYMLLNFALHLAYTYYYSYTYYAWVISLF